MKSKAGDYAGWKRAYLDCIPAKVRDTHAVRVKAVYWVIKLELKKRYLNRYPVFVDHYEP